MVILKNYTWMSSVIFQQFDQNIVWHVGHRLSELDSCFVSFAPCMTMGKTVARYMTG